MPKRLVAVALILFLLTSISSARKKAADPVMPDVTARGRALFEYYQAAWHATDALRATNPSTQPLGRYIGRKSDSGWRVAFGHINDKRDKFVVAYEAAQGATLQEFTVKKLDPPIEDTTFRDKNTSTTLLCCPLHRIYFTYTLSLHRPKTEYIRSEAMLDILCPQMETRSLKNDNCTKALSRIADNYRRVPRLPEAFTLTF